MFQPQTIILQERKLKYSQMKKLKKKKMLPMVKKMPKPGLGEPTVILATWKASPEGLLRSRV